VEYNVRNILGIYKDPLDKRPESWTGANLSQIKHFVEDIDFSEIRKRKALYNRLYHEASISHEHGLGISFTDMLSLLAHHKLIVDAEALV
jgi:hypothetical protein